MTLKVKFFDFEIITRSRSVPTVVSSRDDLESLAIAPAADRDAVPEFGSPAGRVTVLAPYGPSARDSARRGPVWREITRPIAQSETLKSGGLSPMVGLTTSIAGLLSIIRHSMRLAKVSPPRCPASERATKCGWRGRPARRLLCCAIVDDGRGRGAAAIDRSGNGEARVERRQHH